MAAYGQLRAGVGPAVAARPALALMDGLQVQWLLDRACVDMAAGLEAYFRQLMMDEAWKSAAADRSAPRTL